MLLILARYHTDIIDIAYSSSPVAVKLSKGIIYSLMASIFHLTGSAASNDLGWTRILQVAISLSLIWSLGHANLIRGSLSPPQLGSSARAQEKTWTRKKTSPPAYLRAHTPKIYQIRSRNSLFVKSILLICAQEKTFAVLKLFWDPPASARAG